jgi:hypothetical protein
MGVEGGRLLSNLDAVAQQKMQISGTETIDYVSTRRKSYPRVVGEDDGQGQYRNAPTVNVVSSELEKVRVNVNQFHTDVIEQNNCRQESLKELTVHLATLWLKSRLARR